MMNYSPKVLATCICLVTITSSQSVNAQVNLTLVGANPGAAVSLQVGSPINIDPEEVFAGIYNQIIEGVAAPSFCIDVSRDINLGQTYTDYSYADLAISPLAPAGPMGVAGAVDIEKLWAAYFPAALASDQDAAALQVAIWEDIGLKVGYSVVVNGNDLGDPIYAEAANMLSSLPLLTEQADLIGLVSPTGQNFVVQTVPEPSTLALGGLGGLGLFILRKRK